MAALTVENTGLGSSSLTPTFVSAAGGGDTFLNDGRTMFYCKNAGGSPITVTVDTPNTLRGGIAIENPVTTVPAGSEEVIGPFDPAIFNQAAGTGVSITYSDVTSVTVAAIRLQKLF
jgi:hypothetical protein